MKSRRWCDELAHDSRPPTYGLMAEFPSADALVAAAHQVHAAGYQKVDAYTPYPIEAVSEALALPRSKMPLVVLIGGLLGGFGGYMLQFWSQVIRYPMNIGGRPVHSWPSFIVPTFECTILGAALAAVVGMIADQRPAAALPPGVQRAALRPGLARPLLPGDRGGGPEVRFRRHPALPGRPATRARCPTLSTKNGSPLPGPGLCSWRPPAAGRTCTTSTRSRRYGPSTFFADGQGARPIPAHTVARGDLREGFAFTGLGADNKPVAEMPFPVDPRGAAARPGALQHLLLPLPRPAGQRQRHDRAARLQAADLVPHRAAAHGAGRLLLQRA